MILSYFLNMLGENQKPKVEIRLNDNIKDLIRGWAKLDYVGFFDTPERLYGNWFFILRDYIKVATWIKHKDFPEDVLKKIQQKRSLQWKKSC